MVCMVYNICSAYRDNRILTCIFKSFIIASVREFLYAYVCECVWVFMCMCLPPRLLITSGVMWRDIDLI